MRQARFLVKPRKEHFAFALSFGSTSMKLILTSRDEGIVSAHFLHYLTTKFTDNDVYATDIEWLPNSKGVNEIFAVGFSDGSFRLITKLAKIDKNVTDAHKGALISLKWSNDGSALATAGEDGFIKIYSKTGNLRTILVQIDKPIYCVTWGPDNESVLFCFEKTISIKPLQAGSKQIQWKAHDGVVLKVDWNPTNNLIVSGGEDCRYKIWDAYGRLLFASNPYDYVITSVSWAPNGEYFAVGAFEMVRLCDKTGWTYSFQKTNTGSLMKLAWSSDGTIIAGAGGNGNVLFGFLVDRSLTWENWEVKLNEDNKIVVFDMMNELTEELDFRERVINMAMGYNNLIVTTASQCYIYSTNNWNTPHIFDVKDAVSTIIQSPKYFLLVDVANGILIYNYEGKMISNPKITGIKFEFLNKKKISLSQDALAIIDITNNKTIKFFDVTSGKPLQFIYDHSMEIQEISLNKTEVASDRKIAFVDSNRDLFLSPTHKKDPIKLCSMTYSFLWNDKNDILAAISDGRLITWYYPNAIYVDKDLMDLCKTVKEAAEIGRMSQMITLSPSQVILRRKDGGLITLAISPFPGILFEFCEKNKWEKAIRLCRFVKEQTLWACLAAVSLNSRELNTAEIALAAIEAVDKVEYINYVKELPSDISRNAALALYFHKNNEAENALIQAKLFYRAIKLNIKLFRWERALELAVNYKTHLDTVLAYRKRYLESLGQEETNKKFQKHFAEVGELDWEKIKAKIKQDKEKEGKGKQFGRDCCHCKFLASLIFTFQQDWQQ
eukprot:TRINITY_DN3774_c0_g2_i1.p1 TRINITY_DN3774_c0_g2~~TRINITY_DN3774_c0_g2_i1.p1  ORF type:complete len:779 (-),score=217.27 TRINITY_DN3774_c0_g2_i1:42-2378(-)